jgi:carbonic anhydrase
MVVEKLIQGNQEFVKTFEKEEELYQKLAQHGQHPKVLWIGCSDSRVVPEFIVNADAGDLFIIRNIANIIPPSDANDLCSSSVLEYALLELKVEHIVVCGHTGCGGITELVKGTPNNSRVSQWLRYASQKKAINDMNTDSYILQTIKDNILLQAEHLLTFDFIKENNNLTIHKWLYDMHSGDISYYYDKERKWIKLDE